MPTTFPLSALALVAFGGGLGAAARYMFGLWATSSFDSGFPWGTWGVNIIGGLAMGALVPFAARHEFGDGLQLLLGVGFLGGFTTFSAFSLEFVDLMARGQATLGLAYAVSSVAGSAVALWAGATLARSLA